MKVTHKELLEGARLSFADCFEMEYRMSQAFVVCTCTCIPVYCSVVIYCVVHCFNNYAVHTKVPWNPLLAYKL